MIHDYNEYYRELRKRLGRLTRALPETMAGIGVLHKASVGGDGALDLKTRELIAVATGIAVRCDGCIASHVNSALRAGASREEVLETIGVSVFMGGGPSTVYGAEALAALDQFLEKGAGGAQAT
jgi:AhpD family alkylhydroperoxidase